MTTKGSVMTTEVARIAQARKLPLAHDWRRNSLPGRQLRENLRRNLRARTTAELARQRAVEQFGRRVLGRNCWRPDGFGFRIAN
jgi:hypothetical protein